MTSDNTVIRFPDGEELKPSGIRWAVEDNRLVVYILPEDPGNLAEVHGYNLQSNEFVIGYSGTVILQFEDAGTGWYDGTVVREGQHVVLVCREREANPHIP